MAYPSSNDINHMYQAYGLCTMIFVVIHLCLIALSANPENHPEEDKFLNLPEPPQDLKRRERMFHNHLENVPIQLVVLWGAFIVQIGALTDINSNFGQDEVRTLTALVIIYTISRILHALFYKFAVQPARSIVFLISQLCVLVSSIVMCRSAFKVNF